MHKIDIIQIANKYCFKADNFDSVKHSFILGLKPFYSYAWEATRDARKVLKTAKTVLAETDAQHVQVVGEDDSATMAESLYDKTYKGVAEKLSGISESDTDAREMAYNEIKMIVQGLLLIKENKTDDVRDEFVDEMIKKFSELTKEHLNDLLQKDLEDGKIDEVEGDFQPLRPEERMVSDGEGELTAKTNWFAKFAEEREEITIKDFSFDEIKEIIEEFAICACRALQDTFPDITYILNPENQTIDLVSSQSKKKYIKLTVDDNLILDGVYPESDLPTFNSLNFYQLYWKPIVDEIGAICINDNILLTGGLPDLPRDNQKVTEISAFNIKNKSKSRAMLTFIKDPQDWKIDVDEFEDGFEKVAQVTSKYTEEDYIGDGNGRIVECINPDLKSIFGKKGTVAQVIPTESFVLLDVNFGHLIQRVDEKDIKILQ